MNKFMEQAKSCDSIRNYFLSDKDEKPKRKSLKNIHDIEEIKR